MVWPALSSTAAGTVAAIMGSIMVVTSSKVVCFLLERHGPLATVPHRVFHRQGYGEPRVKVCRLIAKES
jgi:hypothetical protein